MEEVYVPKIIVVEDEFDVASANIRHLDINHFVNEIAYIGSTESLSNHILDGHSSSIYLVDVNLGPGRDEEGIDIIRIVRQKFAKALIIVLTGNKFKKDKCMEAGANYFFVKAIDYQKTIHDIRTLIVNFLIENKLIKVIETYIATIAHIDIDKRYAKLICKIGENLVEKNFRLDPIITGVQDELIVDKSIKITVVEIGKQVTIIFDKADGLQNNSEEFNSETVKRKLFNSRMWNPKF